MNKYIRDFKFMHSFFAVAAVFTLTCNSIEADTQKITLPDIDRESGISVKDAIYNRKAKRMLTDAPLSLLQAATLLWAGGGKTVDGVTGATRAYAAAGGIHPLEFYLVAESVEGLDKGIYRYNWKSHSLVRIRSGSFMKQIKTATYSSSFRKNSAAACIIITAEPSLTAEKYGKRGKRRYVPMAAGAAGQNIHLAAQALGVGTYLIGAFKDDRIISVLGLQKGKDKPMYVMPAGMVNDNR
ncbi:MAG: SagB/ThcOx family dehydrogenase [Chitinispirillaceae bacterium]